MFKAPTPPQYSIDAEAVFISARDPAWRKDEIEKLGKLEKAEADKHPLRRYWNGETRFDLDAKLEHGGEAVTVASFLDETATKFVIRPLDERARRRVMEHGRTRSTEQAVDAVEFGLVEVRDPGLELRRDRQGLLTPETITMISVMKTGLLDELSLAIWDLTEGDRSSAAGKP